MHSNSGEFGTVSVVGLGYIGLPTAATIATRGVKVIGVDVNAHVVDQLNRGKAHFAEPDLDMLLDAAVMTGQLRAVTAPQPADAFIIAVPTPFRDDRSADLSFVEQAARAIAKVLRKGDLVVLESTSPVGTTEKLCDWIAEERPDLVRPRDGAPGDFHAAYCPERILPGRMVFELVENDRIIGGISGACAERAAALYRLFVRGTLFPTTAPQAEFVKLIENAYRDVNIAFANELSMLCETMQLDVWDAIALANRHPRVNILSPGPGVGGHCIAVDPWFLISAHPDRTRLMGAARHVNDAKPALVLDAVRARLAGLRDPLVACLGLAYKPDVDDLRESPALQIAAALADDGVRLAVVEPHVAALPRGLSDRANVALVSLDDALLNADVLVLLVAHAAFRDVDGDRLAGRDVIDTVGLWRQHETDAPAARRGP